jgi:hypothetical protein
MNESKTYKDENGYVRFKDSNKLYHRWVKEKEIGRPLIKGEIVHHKNGNIEDNRPENLELLTAKEHYKRHVVPILEARREAQVKEKLVPIIAEEAIKAILLTFAIGGAVMFILGLIIKVKVDMWYEGLLFMIGSLFGWLIWLITRMNK